MTTQQKSFEEFLQEAIKFRREAKVRIKDTITQEEIEQIQRNHHIKNTTLFNTTHGKLGSKDNELVR